MRSLGFTYAGSATTDSATDPGMSVDTASSSVADFIDGNKGILIAIVAALAAFAILKAIEK